MTGTLAILKPTGKTRPNLPRRKRTEIERAHNKYRCAIRATQNRVRKLDERGAWHSPPDVDAIMHRWDSNWKEGIEGKYPSETEMARLNAYLADPANHSVIPYWRCPKDPICIPVFFPVAPTETEKAS